MTPLPPSRVLILDDDEVDRMQAQRLLRDHVEVVEAARIDDARAILETEPIDCVLIDYHFPDTDGLEIAARLAEFGVPLVMLTGAGNEKIAVRAMKHGVSDYLVKSELTTPRLLAAIASAIRSGELSRKLEEERRELQEFVRVAAHDLQAPLRSIQHFGAMVAKDAGDALDERSRSHLQVVTEQAERLSVLVSDLLRYTATGRSARPLETVDLSAILAWVRTQVEITLNETEGQLLVDNLPDVLGDRVALQQLFVNLVGNGLKFRGEEPPVVRVTAERESDRVRVTVRDNGIGISPEFHMSIFEPLKRLHAASDYAGSGLGLSICRRIAEQHGTELTVESAEGTGSAFSFALEAAPSASDDAGPTS